jgi:ATP-binding protein involved in chromosome partitioning
MAKSNISRDAIIAALSKVEEPELHRDLVSLNMILNIEIQGGAVKLDLVLTTPACPLKSELEEDVRQAVLSIPGVESVEVRLNASVRPDGQNRSQTPLKVKNIVAVASGKGGVGKTTTAVNISVALAKAGAKVGLLDADIYGPNVPTMIGVHRLPPMHSDKIVPAEAFGVKVMSIGFLIPPGQAVIWRGPMLHSAIRQFLYDVDWGDLDYLIIDLPPGTGDAQLSLAQSVPLTGGLIVTLPQAVSLEDASRAIWMFKELKIPVLGVVENMSYLQLSDGTRMDIFGQGGGEKLAQANGAPFLGAIPLDPSVRISGDDGQPVVQSNPDSSPAIALIAVSEKLAAQISIADFNNQSSLKIEVTG